MKLRRVSGVYGVLMGLFNAGVWIMLISTGRVPDLVDEVPFFVLHWTSELAMDCLMVAGGVLVLRRARFGRDVYYLGSGMLLLAIVNALAFYLVSFSLPFVVMGTAVTLATAVLCVVNYRQKSDLYFFTLGVVIYGGLNILANALRDGNLSSGLCGAASLACSLLLLAASIRKAVRIERPEP